LTDIIDSKSVMLCVFINLKSITMKIRIISLFLLCIAISFSCQKEDRFNTGPAESLYLNQIIIDKTPSFEYTYNGAKFINEEKGRFSYTINTYNEKNQLVTAEYYANLAVLSNNPQVSETAMSQKNWVAPVASNLSGSVKYEYNDAGQLIKSTYSPASGSQQYSQYTYDENDRINRQNLYWENSQVGYIEYLYNLNGNLVEERLYNISAAGAAELSTTTVYEHDNKQNPFKLTSKLMVPGINTNLNNIIKETQTIHMNAAQGGDIVTVTESSFKYNTNGYPISKNGNVEYLYL
jgi:YD repeat-containing protein